MSPIVSEIPTYDFHVYTVVGLGRVRTEVRAPRHGGDDAIVAAYHYKFLSEAQVRDIHATIVDLWDKRGRRATGMHIAS